MKSMLLITSCILLVIALPVPQEASFPQSHSDGEKINGLSIASGTGNSATLGPRGNPYRGPEPLSGVLSTLERRSSPHDPHNNEPAHIPTTLQYNIVTYSFGETVEGPIIKKLGLPKPLPRLKELPKELSKWEVVTLEHIAGEIRQQYEAVFSKIKNDRNKIERAQSFVLSDGSRGARPRPIQERDIEVPKWPDKGPDYAQGLVQLIMNSHQELQLAASRRNHFLKKLLDVGYIREIPDPSIPNEYVTYWKQLATTQEPSGPGIYFLGTTTKNVDVTAELGLYQKVSRVKRLPQGWKKFDKDELARIAAGILTKDLFGTSTFENIIKKARDDRNMINRAIRTLRGSTWKQSAMDEPYTLPNLPPVDPTAQNYNGQLIEMITSADKKLRNTVNARNFWMELDKLQLPLDSTSHPDDTNPYITEWGKRHQVQTIPASEPDATLGDSRSGDRTVQPATSRKTSLRTVATDVSRKKRPRTSFGRHNPDTTANIDPALFTIGFTGVVDNPLSPKAVTLGIAPGHPGGPPDNSHLPATQSDTLPTSPSQHNPSSPEDIDWGAFIDFGHHDA